MNGDEFHAGPHREELPAGAELRAQEVPQPLARGLVREELLRGEKLDTVRHRLERSRLAEVEQFRLDTGSGSEVETEGESEMMCRMLMKPRKCASTGD